MRAASVGETQTLNLPTMICMGVDLRIGQVAACGVAGLGFPLNRKRQLATTTISTGNRIPTYLATRQLRYVRHCLALLLFTVVAALPTLTLAQGKKKGLAKATSGTVSPETVNCPMKLVS